MYALINCKMYTGQNILYNYALVVHKEIIQSICPINFLPKTIKTYNLLGSILTPGFIDLQLNGCGGVQFNDYMQSISIKTLKTMQTITRRFGCTSFLPTLITSNDQLIQKAIKIIRIFLTYHSNQVLGLHLEGPFINPKKKGIHNVSLIRLPTQKMIDYICDNNDVVKKITLAPELLNKNILKKLQKNNICIAIGHSNASYQEAKLSFSLGTTFGTHLFNAMPSLTARDPGVIGAIFDTPEIYTSIIADGLHVHWSNIILAKKIKQNHLLLITDGTSPVGSNHITNFKFAGKTIFYKNKTCMDQNGILSGSDLTMIQAIQNTVKHTDIPLDEVLRMATLYPARAIGMDYCLGSLEVNKIANLTVLNKKFQIQKTIVNGKIYDFI